MESGKIITTNQTSLLRRRVRALLGQRNVDSDKLINQTQSVTSCSVYFKNLETHEYCTDSFLDSGTSGDSSACFTENEEEEEEVERKSLPTLYEAANVLVDESTMELDPDYESIATSKDSRTQLLIMDVDKTLTRREFKEQLEDFKFKENNYRHYLKLYNLKFLFFNGSWSLKISLRIMRDSISEFLHVAFTHPKMRQVIGHSATVYWLKEDRYIPESLFMVIFREIPFFLSTEKLKELCHENEERLLFLGTKTSIKEADCCLARFASLEETESVCYRLNDLPLRFQDHTYYLKAHLHPDGSRKRTNSTKKSLFTKLFVAEPESYARHNHSAAPLTNPNNTQGLKSYRSSEKKYTELRTIRSVSTELTKARSEFEQDDKVLIANNIGQNFLATQGTLNFRKENSKEPKNQKMKKHSTADHFTAFFSEKESNQELRRNAREAMNMTMTSGLSSLISKNSFNEALNIESSLNKKNSKKNKESDTGREKTGNAIPSLIFAKEEQQICDNESVESGEIISNLDAEENAKGLDFSEDELYHIHNETRRGTKHLIQNLSFSEKTKKSAKLGRKADFKPSTEIELAFSPEESSGHHYSFPNEEKEHRCQGLQSLIDQKKSLMKENSDSFVTKTRSQGSKEIRKSNEGPKSLVADLEFYGQPQEFSSIKRSDKLRNKPPSYFNENVAGSKENINNQKWTSKGSTRSRENNQKEALTLDRKLARGYDPENPPDLYYHSSFPHSQPMKKVKKENS